MIPPWFPGRALNIKNGLHLHLRWIQADSPSFLLLGMWKRGRRMHTGCGGVGNKSGEERAPSVISTLEASASRC